MNSIQTVIVTRGLHIKMFFEDLSLSADWLWVSAALEGPCSPSCSQTTGSQQCRHRAPLVWPSVVSRPISRRPAWISSLLTTRSAELTGILVENQNWLGLSALLPSLRDTKVCTDRKYEFILCAVQAINKGENTRHLLTILTPPKNWEISHFRSNPVSLGLLQTGFVTSTTACL